MHKLIKPVIISVAISSLAFSCFGHVRKTVLEDYMDKCQSDVSGQDETSILSDCQFAKALGEEDQSANIKAREAKIMYEFGDMISAETIFLQVFDSDPRNFETNYYLAEINRGRYDFSSAEDFYKRAYDVSPSEEIAIKRIRNLMRTGDANSAKSFLFDVQDKTDNITFYESLVDFVLGNDISDVEEAVGHEEAILLIKDFSDRDAEIRNEKYKLIKKADILLRIGETDFAFFVLDDIKDDKKYRDLMISYGKAYFLEGNYEESEQYFRDALQIDSDYEETLIYLIKVCELNGKYEDEKNFRMKYENITLD